MADTKGDDVVLRVSHVSKSFKLPMEGSNELKRVVINWLKGIKGYRTQRVLRDISFEVHRGDFLGIVGRNGSGKSTLLKLISRIYYPDKGKIEVNGSLVPFIELGVGFNPELTGRENVYLNGAMLGFSTAQIDAMYDDIVEFAELGDFMDQKLKNYSSGMQVRLAFSVAIKAQGDVLVLDEVLAVGDEAFQRKCERFFNSVKDDPNKTVILVTHSMSAVRQYCNRAIMIDDGKIAAEGDPDDVADAYSLENINDDPNAKKSRAWIKKARDSYIHATFDCPQVLSSKDTLKMTIKYKSMTDRLVYPRVSVQVNNLDLVTTLLRGKNDKSTNDQKEHTLKYELPLKSFVSGDFRVVASIADGETGSNVATIGYNDELPLKIATDDPKAAGLVNGGGKLYWA